MQASKETNDTYLDIMMSEIDRINLISSEMLILGKSSMYLLKRPIYARF